MIDKDLERLMWMKDGAEIWDMAMSNTANFSRGVCNSTEYVKYLRDYGFDLIISESILDVFITNVLGVPSMFLVTMLPDYYPLLTYPHSTSFSLYKEAIFGVDKDDKRDTFFERMKQKFLLFSPKGGHGEMLLHQEC